MVGKFTRPRSGTKDLESHKDCNYEALLTKSDAKDKVLSQWRSLRMQTQETMQRYIDKFWELHLKATVYKKLDFAKQKQQFCAGLSEEVGEYVNSQRP